MILVAGRDFIVDVIWGLKLRTTQWIITHYQFLAHASARVMDNHPNRRTRIKLIIIFQLHGGYRIRICNNFTTLICSQAHVVFGHGQVEILLSCSTNMLAWLRSISRLIFHNYYLQTGGVQIVLCSNRMISLVSARARTSLSRAHFLSQFEWLIFLLKFAFWWNTRRYQFIKIYHFQRIWIIQVL